MGFKPTTSPPPFLWEEVSVELELIGFIILYIGNSLVPSCDRPMEGVICSNMPVICSIMRPYPTRPKSPPVYINHIENFLQIVSNETLTVCALHRISPSCSNYFFSF